ncbi:hypothetical protein CU098_004211 [Rhizopus stolonifer]|uniref:SEC7 domain-containing protein n=1 Tax=Rhizopus stolonifer TaxID=4846 RepID=A0A367J1C1_RHIST|nr:hypothetical protein CU098_004211 [Rhizopus stolonifer]
MISKVTPAIQPSRSQAEPTHKPLKLKSKAKSFHRLFKKLARVVLSKKCHQKKLQESVWYDITPDGHTAVIQINLPTASAPQSDSLSMSSLLNDKTTSDYAQRIWDEDATVYSNMNRIVEWIGNGQPDSNAILKAYLQHFDFKGLKLEQAFRNLCSKLHLKGETQQIDRILSRFAERYFECNPKCIFGSSDVVHAIVYSLLLLNTDLHVAQGDYKKMSRSAFIKNTLCAIQAQLNISTCIDEHSISEEHKASGLSFQSFDWIPLQRTPSGHSGFSSRSSNYAPSLDSSISTHSHIALGSKSWQLEVKNLLKQMYSSIRYCQISDPSSPPTSIHQSNRVSTVLKRSMGTIIWRQGRDTAQEDDSISSSISSVPSSSQTSLLQYQIVASHLQTEIPTSYTSNAPYYKEGMVVRKHLLEKAHQKAKHRDWKDCFMVIERSQLKMYKLDSTSEQRKRHLIRHALMTKYSDNEVVGGGDWLSNAQLMGSIDLKHTLANALPSGYSRQRQHAFALQQPNGAVYLFQVGSEEQVHEWVSTCNYWAARESKEPMTNGVSSMEYGWTCTKDMENTIIHEWQAPIPPSCSSLLEEPAQLEALHKHIKELSNELDQHRDIKPKMEARFAGSKLAAKVMVNWENKSSYLLHEIIKYQNYCDAIEKSLALQNSICSFL